METTGNSSEKDLITLVRSCAILNCPTTIEDVDIFFKISKKNTLTLNRNTTITRPDIQAANVIKVPICIIEKALVWLHIVSYSL